MYDSIHQMIMTKSVSSKDQPVIIAAITLYQKVFVIVEIVGTYSKCLKHIMMMMYCTIIKAPETNEHANQNQVNHDI